MNTLIKFRDSVRKYVLAREVWMMRIWNMVTSFVALLIINSNFGYLKVINHWYIALAIALVCGFLPFRGAAIVISLVLFINLYTLSMDVALVAAGLYVAGLLFCAYFHGKNTYNMVTVPVCFGLHAPFVIPMGAGLLRNLNELSSVICGGVMAYYLHVVKENVSAILDETSNVSAISLIKEEVFTSSMFYFFMVALSAMFVIVYLLRTTNMRMSWLIADACGVIVEFFIMLSGYLLIGNKAEIPSLIWGNILVFFVGFFLNYFVLDLDYSRIEKVQFEDDDYYYYVTAVPKIRIVEEEKEVKTF